MEFSTSGCRTRFGTIASRNSGGHVEMDAQPVFEARALDFEVQIEDSQFFAERHFMDRAVGKEEAQQLAEPRNRALREFRIFMHQRRDRVQGIEEKVRVQLHLQRAQLGLDELRLEVGGVHQTLLIAPVVDERMLDQNDDRIEERPGIEGVFDRTNQLATR